MLQASDYQAPADVENCTERYTFSSTQMTITLNGDARQAMAANGTSQFRVTLDRHSFSNFNGALRLAVQPPRASFIIAVRLWCCCYRRLPKALRLRCHHLPRLHRTR
jgi:hypothetical protein